MSMERHEVPTVFVRGTPPAGDVAYAEAELCDALRHTRVARYVVLWVDVESDDPAVVEVEVGIADDVIGTRAAGANVRIAADRCMEHLVADLARSLVDNGTS